MTHARHQAQVNGYATTTGTDINVQFLFQKKNNQARFCIRRTKRWGFGTSWDTVFGLGETLMVLRGKSLRRQKRNRRDAEAWCSVCTDMAVVDPLHGIQHQCASIVDLEFLFDV